MVDEIPVPWPAIPSHANAFWNLDLLEVRQATRSDLPPLSVVVAAQWPDEQPQLAGAWRIAFETFRTYRLRQHGYAGNLPLTRLDDRSALWEMLSSTYLVEGSVPGGIAAGSREQFHHYVICTGGNDVFEVIATAWSVEPLGEEWAQPFTYPVPY